MLTLEVLTPSKRVVAPVRVTSVTLTGALGEMTLLPGHARLISTLETGVLRFETEAGPQKVAAVLTSGFVEVNNDKVIVLAETLELAKEIDVDRAKRAQVKAEQRLNDKELSPDSFAKHQLKLQRALIRQQLAQESLS